MEIKRAEVKCDYLQDGLCKSILNNEAIKSVRKESCNNEQKSACCYLCSLFYACDIGCDYLGKKCSLCGSELRYAKMDLRTGGWEGLTRLMLGNLGEAG